MADAARPVRALAPGGARQRARARLLRRQPRALQDARVRISAFYAGVAGSLLAIATTFVNPDTFPVALSIFLLVGVVVGGLGSLWPLVFGAIFIHFMQIEWAQQVESVIPNWLPLLGDIDTDAAGAPAVAFGVILILIMLVAPGGAAASSSGRPLASMRSLRPRSRAAYR